MAFGKSVKLALRYTIVILALAGATVSTLAFQVHYSNAVQPCDINAHWDCGIVNHSRFSMVHGIPVAAIGIAGYLLIALLSALKRTRLTLVCALLGFFYALYLTRIEADVLQVWCLYCVISQTIIAAIVLLAGIATVRSPRDIPLT